MESARNPTHMYDGEAFALTAGMLIASDYCSSHPEISNILFISDSSSAITNATRTHTHPSQRLSCIFAPHANSFLQNDAHHITLLWTKGHKGTRVNEEADRLAKLGRAANQDDLLPTLSYYAEKCSRLTLKHWKRDFNSNWPTGAFGEVTFHPPSTKPSKVSQQLADDPEVFGQLTQVRTMHGYNPPYYHCFHINRDLECACGIQVNPNDVSFHRRHVLNACDQYTPSSPSTSLSLPRSHHSLRLNERPPRNRQVPKSFGRLHERRYTLHPTSTTRPTRNGPLRARRTRYPFPILNFLN